MGFVVDTNVISELIKANPNVQALDWLDNHQASLFLTSITIEELRFGEYMMPKGKKRAALKEWIDSLLIQFRDCVLDFDAKAADICAKFHELALSSGHTPTIEDLIIAAIADANNCSVVTRNTKDFDYLDIDLVNPFSA